MVPWITLSWSLIFIILAAGLNGIGYSALSLIFIRIAKILFLVSLVIFPITLFSIKKSVLTHAHKFELHKSS